MSSNTFVKAQKEVINDAIKELVDSSVFLGVTIYGARFQGTNYGYSTGGINLPGGPTSVPTNTIDRFPFVSEVGALDVGDMSAAGGGRAGQSSSENGYASVSSIIDKFPFAAVTTNAVDVGGLSNGRGTAAGQSSATYGYTSGGFTPGIFYNTIDKFPFSFEGTATDVGDISVSRYYAAGQSSTTHGYISGGSSPGVNNTTTQTNSIEKFPFASDTSASSVGVITPEKRAAVAGQSSATHGYTTAGFRTPSVYYNTIDKFPFASDANASDVGDLTITHAYSGNPAGQSSTTDGYNSGGNQRVPPSVPVISIAIIDKFPFTSDTNASNIGNLTVSRTAVSGQQF